MPKHIPGRGPYLVTGSGGTAVDTELIATRTRTKSEPAVKVTDPKSRKVREIPRITWSARITPAKR